MKKYLIILILASLMGCNVLDVATDIHFKTNLGIALSEDTPYITEYEAIMGYVYNNIYYKAETEEHWQSYEETVSLGTGDCEDYVIAFLNILYNSTGIKGELGAVLISRSVESGGWADHAVAKVGSLILDPTNMTEVTLPLAYIYTFDEIFN